MNQKINSYIGIVAVLAVGIGASYLIVTFANNADFSFAASIEVNIEAEK